MISNELRDALLLFRPVVSKTALSPTYRSLELGAGFIRGCSPWAQLEVKADLDLETPVVVDGQALMAVAAYLPDRAEVAVEATENALSWSCGSAKGRLATLPGVRMPVIDRKPSWPGWAPPNELRRALHLGSISAASDSLAQAGMYGVVLDLRDRIAVGSCDGTTISFADIPVYDDTLTHAPELVVVSPEAAGLFSALLRDKSGKVWLDDKAVFYKSDTTRALIKQVPHLRNDLTTMLERYADDAIVAPLARDRLTAFIKRVGAMAADKKASAVGISASEGRLNLTFLEGATSSEEYYLVDEIPDMPEVQIDAVKTARALQYVEEIVLDHLAKHVVVMRGEGDGVTFSYLISGRR